MARGDGERAEILRMADELGLSLGDFANACGLHHKTFHNPITTHPERPWKPHPPTMRKARDYYRAEMAKRGSSARRPMGDQAQRTITEAAMMLALSASGTHDYTPAQMRYVVRRIDQRLAEDAAAGRITTDEAMAEFIDGLFAGLGYRSDSVSDC